MNNNTKVQWCNDPISSLISIGELLRDSSFICGELAIQKQPLPLNDERILNDWEEPNEFCAQVMIQKKVWAHPKSIEDGMLWSVFIHHPLMRLAMMNVFKLNEFHWNHRPKAFHPVCFSSALHSSGPACYPTLNQSFFFRSLRLLSSSPSFHSFHPFVPLFFHIIHPFIMLYLGWLPACSHNHRETSPSWQILCPGRTRCTGEKNKCFLKKKCISIKIIFFKT